MGSHLIVTLVGSLILVSAVRATSYKLQFNNANVDATIDSASRELTVQKDGKVMQRILMDRDIASMVHYEEIANGFKLWNADGEEVKLAKDVDSVEFSLFTIARRVQHRSKVVTDCVRLAGSNWFGGPQQKYQYWPIQKLKFNEYSMLTKEADNCAVADRYWLNSLGSFVYVDDETPLFVDQNFGQPGFMCLEAKKFLPYDIYDSTYSFVYQIGVAKDAKEVHMAAVRNILGKPSGHPAESMVKYPIWSTWARYKRDIDQHVVLEFANEIVKNGWPNSQFELDDDWEMCYGALKFNTTKFPNIRETINAIRAAGFPRVTIWIHPFINKGCEPVYSDSKRRGYLVADRNGNTDTEWWNSKTGQAAYVDFTNPEAAQWFTERLQAILDESGIDSFKFDAGETSWTPPDPVLHGPQSHQPNMIVDDYVRTVAKFGDLVEVRSAHRSQDLPIFVRMIDKDSEWNWNNGLPTLITTLLQMNMVGYPLVLPDMVGGNGYNDHPPNKEMFIRWLQANVFMPSIQFSYVPWDYDAETVQISKTLTSLHEQYTPQIMKRFKLAVSDGYPVNPPLWWISPNDTEAQKVYDQFLLGDDIISAPVTQENVRARDIYLPEGSWVDGNTGAAHTGPKWIRNYSVPLQTLPYFVRMGT